MHPQSLIKEISLRILSRYISSIFLWLEATAACALGKGRRNIPCIYIDLFLDFMIIVFCSKHSTAPLPDVSLLALSGLALSESIIFSDACLFSQG